MGAGRDERALVRAAQRGSASGIEALFRLHWPRAQSIARLTTIRCSHGPNGRPRSKWSRLRTAARNASWAMSSAAAASWTTR